MAIECGHMQFLTRHFDFDMDVQMAMDTPRFFPDPFEDVVELEEPSSMSPKSQFSGLTSIPGSARAGGVADGHDINININKANEIELNFFILPSSLKCSSIHLVKDRTEETPKDL